MSTIKSNRRHALKLLLAGCVTTTAALAVTGCDSLPTRRTASTDGEPLSLEVRQALRNNASTAQLQVSISTAGNGDEVIIKGRVPSNNDFYNIEQVANTVPGVRHVLMDVYVIE